MRKLITVVTVASGLTFSAYLLTGETVQQQVNEALDAGVSPPNRDCTCPVRLDPDYALDAGVGIYQRLTFPGSRRVQSDGGIDITLPPMPRQKTRDAIKRFGDHLKERGGTSTEAKGAQEAKTMLDAAMTLLTDLKQAVSSGKDIFVRRMTEAEAASEPALAQVRQALAGPRIILAP